MTPVSRWAQRTLASTRMSSPSKRIRRVGVDECDFQRQPSICGQRMLRKSEIALVDMNVSWSALEKVLLLYASGDSDSSMQISIITGMQKHMDQWTDLCSYAPSQLVPPKTHGQAVVWDDVKPKRKSRGLGRHGCSSR